MKPSPAATRILVATDNADDARQITRQLGSVFEQVRSASVADTAVGDFDAASPEVLVLAFDAIEKSELYYLGLYRLGSAAIQNLHRTVVLCRQDEARAAFELCRKDYFDDYVLYWPHSQDGNRLAMSVWIACRQMRDAQDALPDHAALMQHARHLAALERAVAEPLQSAVDDLRERIEPALAGTRALADAVRRLRPVVLVVDDDAFSRQLVQRSLDPARWDVTLAEDAAAALVQLRRLRPAVILMDVRLPGLDGVALTRHLKASAHLADIPVVMMTGDARRETLIDSLAAGAAAFVVKPVTRVALEAKLDRIIPR